LTLSAPAFAQEAPNCPPGSWFCENVDVEGQTPPAQQPQQPAAQPQQPAQAQPPQQPQRPQVVIQQNQTNNNTNNGPPVVVYAPPPPQPQAAPPPHVIVVAPWGYHRPPPPPPRPAPPPRPPWRSEFGLNLRLEGIALGKYRNVNDEGAGMGGVGLSLRYRPVAAFAFDVGADLVGGIDYNGFQRTETPITINGIVYVNPRSRVQFYLTGGVQFSHANVKSDTASPLLRPDSNGGYSAEYNYFGGQGGVGLEFRLSRHVALDIDGLGFIRARTDKGATPEFYDPTTGKTTNKSGGGIFRGGVTFWW
jgi:opacity protein-like surface antigen